MGDPETQPILMRLKSDLVKLAEHAVDGTLDQVEAEWDRRTGLGVVMASAMMSASFRFVIGVAPQRPAPSPMPARSLP